MKPRRLKGHKAPVTYCIASRSRPGVVLSSGEDGCICWYDLRCKDVIFSFDAGKEPITSLCFKAGNEDVIYASSGAKVVCFDIHTASSWKALETYDYNKEEINQIAFSPKSSFLAAADDSGDIKIIDTRQQSLYKTLRAVHSSICSTVQFISWKPWTVITGGLDSKLAIWDFSKGWAYNIIDYGMSELKNHSLNNFGQCCNPAFVHSISVLEEDVIDGLNKVCAVARGDGIIDIIDIEIEVAAMKSRSSNQNKKGSKFKSKDAFEAQAENDASGQSQGKKIQLDYALGGHTAAACCVSFSLFGEKGKFLISGGNDASVKIWDWSKCFRSAQTSCRSDLLLDINVKKKVNWLCTTPSDSENLIVCDTSKILKVYTCP